jgi:G3E family GTPase
LDFSVVREDIPIQVPVALLSGFLGAGKTSCLQNLLENKDQLKIGIIVNDVASINIDSKLVASSSNQGIIELQNGCACCSLSDELFTSIEKLLTGRQLDGIVIELSGVADPVAIQNQWKLHAAARATAKLENIVTIIDATTFGTDYMTWDRAGERENWVTPGDDCAANLKIADLLSEQVEAASIIAVNKSDLATPQQIQIAANMARALNKKATIVKTKYGKLSLQRILGPNLRKSAREAQNPMKADREPDHHAHKHEHAHIKPSNSSPSPHTCSDPNCTDPSHSHDHGHSHKKKRLSTSDLGIDSFVYKAQRPFHAGRLMKVLNQWPVPIKEELDLGIIQDYKKVGYETADGESLQEPSPFMGVLRSKGFCWFAPNQWVGANQDSWRHDTAMYWSMAGRQFGISAAGKWWASISDPQMREFFVGNPGEYERIKREDFVSKEFGDRRQEIVFIGTNLNKDYIEVTLNSCLLNNQEMDEYRKHVQTFCLAT